MVGGTTRGVWLTPFLAAALASCGAAGPPPHQQPTDGAPDRLESAEACLGLPDSLDGDSDHDAECPAEPGDAVPADMDRLREAQVMGDHCLAIRILQRIIRARPVATAFAVLAGEKLAMGWPLDARASAEQCLTAEGGSDRTRAECERVLEEARAQTARVVVSGGFARDGVRTVVGGVLRDGTQREIELSAGHLSVAVFVPHRLCCEQWVDLSGGDEIVIDLDRPTESAFECYVARRIQP